MTGAGRGIGAAAARLLAARGARVALAARTQAELEAAAGTIRAAGGEALPVPTDVARPDDVASLFDAVRARLGPVDLLVAAAGVVEAGPLAALEPPAWERLVGVNLTGVYLCARAALADMLPRGRGTIVPVASVGGVAGVPKLPGLVGYAATKAGVIGLTEALAAEVGPAGVRVVCVSPGSTRTDMLAAVAPDALGEAMAPEEVARVIALLASEEAAAVQGENVIVWGPPKRAAPGA